MAKNVKGIAIWSFLGIVVVSLIGYLVYLDSKPSKLDSFAACIKDSGAQFYGAFWCSHCRNQKKLFGKSAKLLPYIECSTPDGQGQLIVCKEKGVETYPTWTFADGSKETGELSLEKLAEKTKCTLP